MTFQDFIILDYYRYKTLAKMWRPSIVRPATPRLTLGGTMEGTFGTGVLMRWQGLISVRHGDAPPGPADGTHEGYMATLLNSLRKPGLIYFMDHNQNEYQVISQGPFDQSSLVNVWNSVANKYFVTVTLIAQGLPYEN